MVPFVGPSCQLSSRTADVQRSVNLRPVPIESGSGRSPFMLQGMPGLVRVATLSGEGRGLFSTKGRLFAVVGDGLHEVTEAGATYSLGTLGTSTGRVSIDANTTQLFMVDGSVGYTMELSTNDFTVRSETGITGSVRTAYLDQYAIYAPPGNSFFLSGLGDAGTVNPLDFASAESSPDDLVSLIVANRQLYLFGSETTEIWINTGADPDMPLQRYDGTTMSVGCVAAHSAQQCNGTPVWLGSSKDGAGSVWMADGYTPRRISTRAVEEVLATSTDISAAYAYTMSWHGSSMYCLRAPGLETTWSFDFLSQSWHEQAELTDGAFSQHRVCATAALGSSVYALGFDGSVYRYDASVRTFDGDTICRDRISPHDVTPGVDRQFFSQFELDVDTGVTGEAMLRMSNDGGATWGDWRRRSLGELGKQKQRLMWNRCGSARDRVWHVRCTDAVPFDIVGARA